MDIQNIQAFLKVSDLGSFSLAAEELHITQPAVSKRIQGLESTMGVKLFDRIGRRVQLTEAAEQLLPNFRRIISELDESHRIISNLSGEIRGTLRLATSHHIGLHRLPPVLKRFARTYPEVTLEIRFMDSEEAAEAVLSAEIEVAVITLPDDPAAQLELLPIWDDPMHVVVSNEHALAREEDIDIDRLCATASILPSHGTYTRRLIDKAFADRSYNTLLETNYLETIMAMIRIGLGWGVLPESMLDDSFRILGIPGLKMGRTLGVTTHSDRTRSSSAEALIQLLKSERT